MQLRESTWSSSDIGAPSPAFNIDLRCSQVRYEGIHTWRNLCMMQVTARSTQTSHFVASEPVAVSLFSCNQSFHCETSIQKPPEVAGLGVKGHKKRVEGYKYPASPAFLSSESSDSFDEDDNPSAADKVDFISSRLRLTLKEFYSNLGDLTTLKRQQPGAHIFKQQMSLFDFRGRQGSNLESNNEEDNHRSAGAASSRRLILEADSSPWS